jgi:U3 small nucleolar RNA-associated protein 14
MAQRNEELRKRMEGKAVRDEESQGSDISDEDYDSELSDRDANLEKRIGRLQENPFTTSISKLGSIAFMQKAEAARKTQNDEDVARMLRDLREEDGEVEEEEEESGRRTYRPNSKTAVVSKPEHNEFEEPESEPEDHEGRTVEVQERPKNKISDAMMQPHTKRLPAFSGLSKEPSPLLKESMENPYLAAANKSRESIQVARDAVVVVNEQQPLPISKKSARKDARKEPVSNVGSDEGGWQDASVFNDDADGQSQLSDFEDIISRNMVTKPSDSVEKFANLSTYLGSYCKSLCRYVTSSQDSKRQLTYDAQATTSKQSFEKR